MPKRWQELSRVRRRAIVGVAVAGTILKVAMLADLERRRANEVRGPRWLWASTALVGSAGLAPAACFLIGRAKGPRARK
jgi:hypothetical protein